MPTLATYRQRTAKLLGPFHSSTATSGSSTSNLEDTAWPISSTLSQDDLYRDYYLFLPAGSVADRTRVVKTYTPATGLLTPDKTWATGPQNGNSYELHGIIPPLTLHDCINEALKVMPIEVEVTLTPSSNLYTRHSLASLTWLTDEWQVRGVGVLPQGSTDRMQYRPSLVRGQVVRDGSTLYLNCGSFQTTDTLYITAIKPAYYHCRVSGGTYGGQSGLALETDECQVDANWLAYGALCEAWRRYTQLLDQTANQRMIRDQVTAAALFSRATEQYFQLPPLTFRPIRSWGPR